MGCHGPVGRQGVRRVGPPYGRPGTTACGAAALPLTIGAVNLAMLFLALMTYEPETWPLYSDEATTIFLESIVYNMGIGLAAPGYTVAAA